MMRALLTAIVLTAFAISPSALGQGEEEAAPVFTPDDGAALSADKEAASSFRNLDEDIQDLKKEVLDLNTELFLLEEELLFPANTQVALFVSMDVGDFFNLDSVQIKVNNKEVANYLYTRREVDALVRGGVHRIYLGNLKVGEHELVAIFTGQGPRERDYRRGASLQFEKGIGPKYVQLEISDRELKQQPEFYIKEWE